MSTRITGIAAAPGIAIGRAFIIDRRKVKTPRRHVGDDDVAIEIARFEQALAASHEQLERVKRKLQERESGDHFQILEAHQLILQDEHLVAPTVRRIREERINAEWALRKTVEEIKSLFNSIEEDYFRERRSDVDFVGDRILRNLLGEGADVVGIPPPGAIIVAHDLSPADTAQVHRAACAAFVTDAGGKTSHSAILARAFNIPAVVGADHASEHIAAGDLLIVDGMHGVVLIGPSPSEIAEYKSRLAAHESLTHELLGERDLPCTTTDGHRVHLYANVELTEEVPSAIDHGAEGIGLYRTEFLYLDRHDVPREEEHFMHARGVLRRVAPYAVTFRTLDLGGDKLAPFQTHREANPALGLRSIRFCLRERDLFKTQLRGLLRASTHGRMRIMFPMISGVDELREAKAVVEEVKADLRREGLEFDEQVEIGIMVEMPSAAMTADLLAREADFLSLGTNDLIQYSLAIDRGNESVSYLYRPLHPAILRTVRWVVDAAHAAGKRVGMCGEMAGEPLFSLVLIGLGLDELSMNPTSIPLVKKVLRTSSLAEARALVDEVMRLETAAEIERHVRAFMAQKDATDLLDATAE